MKVFQKFAVFGSLAIGVSVYLFLQFEAGELDGQDFAASLVVVSGVFILWLQYESITFANELKKRELDLHSRIMSDTFERLLLSDKKHQDVIGLVSKDIARNLKSDPSWAVSAVEAAHSFPYHETTFEKRKRHFREEKAYISTFTCGYILSRIREVRDTGSLGKKVYICIDSGSTTSDLMLRLGRAFNNTDEREQKYFSDNVRIVTNNLAGVDAFISENGRDEEEYFERNGESLTKIFLLPGRPKSAYRSIISDEEKDNKTTEYFESLLARSERADLHVISLVTGNWLTFRQGGMDGSHELTPLTQSTSHKQLKDAFVREADEIIVLAPLPKFIPLFEGQNCDFVNSVLFSDRTEYVPLSMSARKGSLTVITGSRNNGELLYPHSSAVRERFQLKKIDIDGIAGERELSYKRSAGSLGYMIKFPLTADSHTTQIRQEFPHDYTRNSKFFGQLSCEESWNSYLVQI